MNKLTVLTVLFGFFTATTATCAQIPPSDETCTEEARWSPCWIELNNHPGCYAWNPRLYEADVWIWTGKCSNGLAEGEGVLTRNYGTRETRWSDRILVGRGAFYNGKKNGQWSYYDRYLRYSPRDTLDSSEKTGFYMQSLKHGLWIEHWKGRRIEVGSYVNDKKHGQWITLWKTGNTVMEETYVYGKRHGRYFKRWLNGDTEEGFYLNDKMHGRWTFFSFSSQTVSEAVYKNGEKQE